MAGASIETGSWDRALQILRSGGTVALPTDTLYGLCADARSEAAVRRVLAIKGRSPDRPVPVLVDSVDSALALVAAEQAERLRAIAAASWPGALTAILQSRPGLPPGVRGPDGGVGIRIPDAEPLRRLIARAGMPLTGTSCNPSGAAAPRTAAEVQALFAGASDRPDLLVEEAGWEPSGEASRVIDYRAEPPRRLR